MPTNSRSSPRFKAASASASFGSPPPTVLAAWDCVTKRAGRRRHDTTCSEAPVPTARDDGAAAVVGTSGRSGGDSGERAVAPRIKQRATPTRPAQRIVRGATKKKRAPRELMRCKAFSRSFASLPPR